MERRPLKAPGRPTSSRPRTPARRSNDPALVHRRLEFLLIEADSELDLAKEQLAAGNRRVARMIAQSARGKVDAAQRLPERRRVLLGTRAELDLLTARCRLARSELRGSRPAARRR